MKTFLSDILAAVSGILFPLAFCGGNVPLMVVVVALLLISLALGPNRKDD